MRRYIEPDKRCAAQTQAAATDGNRVDGKWVPNSQCMRAAVVGDYCKQHAAMMRRASPPTPENKP